ncbi:translation initiation factor IF-2 [Niastella populi]|uniref:Translation initiation factor IF-2 n=1 Tax=Niastella populi TaxID=550983 RepID=A0A1V9EI49_9BACT|nr:translation initiation factor IF-2 [Niastella populi]OQP45742.1 translation initiation factor IF-2 [Niastella populi]
MAETTTLRLMAAAKEFNIGKETLVDFLVGKGFSKDDLKPTSKLTEDMYRALQQEFQSDKVAKLKSDQIDLPKGSLEAKKKKEDDAAAAKKEVVKKQEPTPVVEEKKEEKVEKVEKIEKKEEIVEKVETVEAVEKIEETPPVEITQPPVVAETVVTPTVEEKEEPKKEEVPEEPKVEETQQQEITKVEAPGIEGPKVLDKIDLSAIDSSTRPKKTPIVVKKKEQEPPVKAKEETPQPKEEKPKPPKEVVQETAAETVAPVAEEKVKKPKEEVAQQQQPAKQQVVVEKKKEQEPVKEVQKEKEEEKEALPPVIENIKADKLTGPKILGKIELPVGDEARTKPKPNEEKRKRKRIPIEKKDQQQSQQTAQERAQHLFKKREPGQQGGHHGGGHHGGGQGQQGGQHRQGGQQGGGNFRGGNRPNQQRHGGGNRHVSREPKEINEKEIQDKIRETQAKLSGNKGGKSIKAKRRHEKRQGMAEREGVEGQDNKLQVTEFISVSELANLMDVSFAEVISKCMSLGLMVSINQRLDAEVIELVAGEFGYEAEFIDMEKQMEMEEEEEADNEEDLQHRAPIVTIMGHVDHGKTSLLDYIRSANVVAGEAGGITQHIGAYEVTLPNGKKISFLDTPGHEAFTAMRARGAKVTDIAVIVVAADDAVMPQTKEAISHAQAAGVPMIFAINKIDKDGANAQKIYEQLAGMNLLVEEWGGKYQSQELSAKKGLNVDKLLEKILLEAELLELKANPDREATGTIIEATLDKGRGYVATVLVQNGTLKHGDLVVSGQFYGRVKAMFNERNKRVDEAPPSTPVLILGLNGAPQAGEKFKVYEDEAEAKEVANRRAQILREQGIRTKKHITLDEIGRRLALGNFKQLNLILKGDVDGSVEALSDSLQKLSTEEIVVSVVHKAVGAISESDVMLATASDAIVVGFNVRPSTQANRLAENEGVEIKLYSIIYNAIEEVKSAMEGMLEPKITEKIVANVEVRNVFVFDKATVAGCYVLDGKILRNSKIRVIRDGIVEYPKGEGQSAELQSLKRFKDDVKEVPSGMECGLTVKNFSGIKVGDIIEAFELEEVKRTL